MDSNSLVFLRIIVIAVIPNGAKRSEESPYLSFKGFLTLFGMTASSNLCKKDVLHQEKDVLTSKLEYISFNSTSFHWSSSSSYKRRSITDLIDRIDDRLGLGISVDQGFPIIQIDRI